MRPSIMPNNSFASPENTQKFVLGWQKETPGPILILLIKRAQT